MSNIDVANEFSFGLGLTADQVEQLPKFNLARGKIIPIQLNSDFTETWDLGNDSVIPPIPPKAINDSNYNKTIINDPTPFFIISSSQVYNINKVNSMPYNDPRNGNSNTTTVIQYTVVQGDETNYGQQDNYTETATLGAGGNGQLARNFYFTPFQGQITQSMVPVYLLPINTTVKDGSNTYLYTFVRADIFITIPSTLSSGVGSGFSYIDYLNNPQNYQSLINPKNLPNYNINSPRSLQVKNLVFLSNNYIGNVTSPSSYSSFNRFLTYDDMYNITNIGDNFKQGNVAGPIFFGLEDLRQTVSIPNPPTYVFNATELLVSYTNPPYGNNSIPPYYLFSGRPYSIFFGLHLNTNTFKNSSSIYGNTFNNYAKNIDTGISLPQNSKGYPVNFLTSLGNNDPTDGTILSNNTSYQKVINNSSNTTESFFQPNNSNYIGSTYAMDEYYIANDRLYPDYGLSGTSSFYNSYKFSLNKYIRFYSGTDGYIPLPIPYNTNIDCDYNGSSFNGYMPNGSNDYNLLNCNVTQAGLVQNMTLQFVPLNYFVSPNINSVPNVSTELVPFFSFLDPSNNENKYPSVIPTTNSLNIISPVNLFNSISSLYTNNSSIICEGDLKINSTCGFMLPQYYNSLLKNFYIEDSNITPDCSTGETYDEPKVTGFYNDGSSIFFNFNSDSCPQVAGNQNLCVPNFEYLSDKINQKPFKCITIPEANIFDYSYATYYGMYEEISGVPTNDNFPNYFLETPDKKVVSSVPSYAPVPYPKPVNNINQSKGETFSNSTIFIVLSIIIGVAILIALIVIVVKFANKPGKYDKARVKYVS
jgi:hypothetical protein